MSIAYALIASLLIVFASYFNRNIVKACSNFRSQLISFSAGIGVTYVFLQLFPEFVEKTVDSYHPALFLSVLFGFIIFFLAEKYVYQHYEATALIRELELEDSTISFVYHFIIGIVLVDLFLLNKSEGILFFIPIFLNTAIHVLPFDLTTSNIIRGIVASSTFLGALVASFIFMPSQFIIIILVGFIVGTLVFSVIRHSLPSGKEGRPEFFVLGVLAYCILIIFKWFAQGYSFSFF